MSNDPFGPGGPFYDPFRREREQVERIKRALGPAHDLRRRMEELEKPLAHVRELQRSGVMSSAYENVRTQGEMIADLKKMTSTPWALSISDTAYRIVQRDADLLERQRTMSLSVLDTMQAFAANRSAISDAIAAARKSATYRQLMAEMLPRATKSGAIAERMRMVDLMTLRASDGDVDSNTALTAGMVIETQRIAEAISEAPTEDDIAALFGELFETIANYVTRLGPKTLTELNGMGLMQWSGWLFGFLGTALAIVALQPSQSPEQKTAISELTGKYEALHQEADRLGKADARANAAYIEKLPRAQLTRDAPLRRKPEGAGEVVLKADVGTVVAIEKMQGRWRLVVFHDPLSNQLARAWVYETALTPLAPALDADSV